MTAIQFRPYRSDDSQDACALERACVQGVTPALRFHRPTFHARSRVYEDAQILCGWQGGRLVGTVAAARKSVELQGRPVTATYLYDLRIDPAHRGQGLSRQLIQAMTERMGRDSDCLYTIVDARDEEALQVMEDRFGADVALPILYECIPVRSANAEEPYTTESAAAVRACYMDVVRPTFVPVYRPECYVGHVESLCVRGAGCSIWTNEEMMTEEVVRLPRTLRWLRAVRAPLSSLLPLPAVPRPGDTIPSLYLYDVFAESEEALGRLLNAVNGIALRRGYTMLYLPLQPHDPVSMSLGNRRRMRFQLSYRILIHGSMLPGSNDRIYVDVRDL